MKERIDREKNAVTQTRRTTNMCYLLIDFVVAWNIFQTSLNAFLVKSCTILKLNDRESQMMLYFTENV